MKCIDCDYCRKGWFRSKPAAYVCIGVKEPFVIEDPNTDCTEYPKKNKVVTKNKPPLKINTDKEELIFGNDNNGIVISNDGIWFLRNGKRISLDTLMVNVPSEWAPVVHGRWIWKDFRGDDTYILACSECLETEGARESAKYCSNCGARMDLED